jgi:hypothetical protein
VRSAEHVTHLVLHMLAAMRRSLQQPTQLWRKVGAPGAAAVEADSRCQGWMESAGVHSVLICYVVQCIAARQHVALTTGGYWQWLHS